MSTFKWLVICFLLLLQLLVLISIDANNHDTRDIMVDFYNQLHKTYHIKQIPKDRLPKQAETET